MRAFGKNKQGNYILNTYSKHDSINSVDKWYSNYFMLLMPVIILFFLAVLFLNSYESTSDVFIGHTKYLDQETLTYSDSTRNHVDGNSDNLELGTRSRLNPLWDALDLAIKNKRDVIVKVSGLEYTIASPKSLRIVVSMPQSKNDNIRSSLNAILLNYDGAQNSTIVKVEKSIEKDSLFLFILEYPELLLNDKSFGVKQTFSVKFL